MQGVKNGRANVIVMNMVVVHENICQTITIRYFCSMKCKVLWVYGHSNTERKRELRVWLRERQRALELQNIKNKNKNKKWRLKG